MHTYPTRTISDPASPALRQRAITPTYTYVDLEAEARGGIDATAHTTSWTELPCQTGPKIKSQRKGIGGLGISMELKEMWCMIGMQAAGAKNKSYR
jgi:hypothetical protein